MKLFQLSLLLLAVASSIHLISSCGPRQVSRIDTNQPVDISGRWNNTDSRMAAEAMSHTIIQAPWITHHLEQKAGKKPSVIVGFVQNKSHEHIDAETFIKDIEQALIQSGKVRLIQGGKKREQLRTERADQQTNASASTMKQFGLESGADYMLQGSINSIVDAFKRKKVVYYQINLELTNMESNEVVWIVEKKIAKYVKN